MMLQTVEQAHDKMAALGKALYSQLFLWLVAKLNTTISAPQRSASPIPSPGVPLFSLEDAVLCRMVNQEFRRCGRFRLVYVEVASSLV